MGDKTGLIDGMSVTANISLDKATVAAVPTEAIVSYQGQDYIFIQVEAGKNAPAAADSAKAAGKEQSDETGLVFKRVPVAAGTSDVGYTEITLLNEIPAASKIVVKGAFFVLAKMTNTEGDEH